MQPYSRRTTLTRTGIRRAASILACTAAVGVLLAVTIPAEEPGRGRSSPDNAVTTWNRIATDAFTPTQGTNPMAQSRTLAILHVAVHDALNAIDARYESYTPGVPRAPHASIDAAVAVAARDVLVALVPDLAALVEPAYVDALARVEKGPAKRAGLAVGQAAARLTMNRRRSDRADAAARVPYVPKAGAGEYQFTPPFDFAAQPGWGEVTPFVIRLADHAADAPLPLATDAYAHDVHEVEALGARDSRARTPEQSAIAQFWYEDSPLGWNRIANRAVRQKGLDAWAAARTLALVNVAMADGFIAGFDAKYRYRFWRPETAIRAAADDGNARTTADPAWQPFLVTPPVPDYPSTHTVLGWAAAEVLRQHLGDDVAVRVDSLTLPGVTREYRGFSEAAEENGLSRVYAGIHFRHAVNAGRQQGRSIGRTVAAALRPLKP